MTITADVAEARGLVRAYSQVAGDAMKDRRFGSAVQAYMTGVTTKFIRKMGNVGERPASTSGRGERWPGFAVRKVRKYGQDTLEGTRFYMRGFRKGKASQKTIAKRAAKARAADVVKLEKAWKKRASGVHYSEKAKMMQDEGSRGGILAHVLLVDRNVVPRGRSTELQMTWGSKLAHLAQQHETRPIIFFHPPTDTPKIRDVLAQLIDIRMKEASNR